MKCGKGLSECAPVNGSELHSVVMILQLHTWSGAPLRSVRFKLGTAMRTVVGCRISLFPMY